MNDRAAYPLVTFAAKELRVLPGQSLLEAIESEGLAIASSCRSGVCQSCLLRADEGQPPAASQKGLKPSLRSQGYFLACLCYPEQDMSCVVGEDGAYKEASKVIDKILLSPDVCRVRLLISQAFPFKGGQFVNLRRKDGLMRSYSIASLPEDGAFIDIHVRRVAEGHMSSWIHDELRQDDELEIQGPHGDCFYLNGDLEQPLLLVGTGTGIAPLFAILRQALAAGHRGPIMFFQGGRNTQGLYFVDELAAFERRHDNLQYVQCLLEDDGNEARGIRVGRIDDIVISEIAAYKKPRVYLCGDPSLVHGLQKRLFLAGVSLRDISSDAFIQRPRT